MSCFNVLPDSKRLCHVLMYFLTQHVVLLFAYIRKYLDKLMHTYFIPKHDIWKNARESNAIQPNDVIVKSFLWLSI